MNKFRYFWENKWYYIDFQKDNLKIAFELFESRPKPTRLYQFTNVKDKNNVDIYEGDIVRTDRFNIWEIKWNFAGWCLFQSGKPQKGYSNIDDLDYSHVAWINDNTKGFRAKVEVVGNICQNPDLYKEING